MLRFTAPGAGQRLGVTVTSGGGLTSVPGGMAGRRARVVRRRAMAVPGGVPEDVVNGHVLHFYFHQAMAAYCAGRNRDFRQLRDVMQGGPGRRDGSGRRGAGMGPGRAGPR